MPDPDRHFRRRARQLRNRAHQLKREAGHEYTDEIRRRHLLDRAATFKRAADAMAPLRPQ